jgi:hypothetical protein
MYLRPVLIGLVVNVGVLLLLSLVSALAGMHPVARSNLIGFGVITSSLALFIWIPLAVGAAFKKKWGPPHPRPTSLSRDPDVNPSAWGPRR